MTARSTLVGPQTIAIICGITGLLPSACLFSGSSGGGDAATLGQETERGSTVGIDAEASSSGTTAAAPTSADASSADATTSDDPPPTTGSDQACASTCTPAAPPGWDGPVFVGSATPRDPLACPVGYEESAVGFRGLDAPPATCDCACSPQGGGCSLAYDFFTFENCTVAIGPSGDASPNSCEGLLVAQTLSGYVRPQLQVQAGVCAPESTNKVSPPTWESALTVCAPPPLAGDCGDEVCVPATPAAFGADACITAEGDVECPGGIYSERTVLYQGLLDDRGCTECTCSVTSAPSCEGAMELFDSNTCNGTPQTFAADGGCYDAAVSGTFGLNFDATVGTTTCAPSGSTPQGEAALTNALTVCCGPG